MPRWICLLLPYELTRLMFERNLRQTGLLEFPVRKTSSRASSVQGNSHYRASCLLRGNPMMACRSTSPTPVYPQPGRTLSDRPSGASAGQSDVSQQHGTQPVLPADFIVTIPVSSGSGSGSSDFATEGVFVFKSVWYRSLLNW